jgi:type 1 glutamine amidotransferase
MRLRYVIVPTFVLASATAGAARVEVPGWEMSISAPPAALAEVAAAAVKLQIPRVAAGPGVVVPAELGVETPVYLVERLGTGDAARRVFEAAKAAGAKLVVGEAEPGSVSALDALAAEMGLRVAVQGSDPHTLLAAVTPARERVGVSIDVPRWKKQGVHFQTALWVLKDSLTHMTVAPGSEPEVALRQAHSARVRPLSVTLAATSGTELAATLETIEKMLRPELTQRETGRPAWRPAVPRTLSWVVVPTVMDWRVFLSARALPGATVLDLAGEAARVGVRRIEAMAGETIGGGLSKPLTPELSPAERVELAKAFGERRAGVGAYRVETLGTEAEGRRVFELAKRYGAWLVVADAAPAWDVDALSRELDIAFRTAGENGPIAIGADDPDVLSARLRALYAEGRKPLYFSIESAEAVAAFEKAAEPIVAEVARRASTSQATRTAAELTAETRARIEAASPKKAAVKPKKPRRLLVVDLCYQGMSHDTIPYANHLLDVMGRQTGAYEPVFSNDLANLRYEKLKAFDAVFLNNNVGYMFADREAREGLLRFVREGGGVGGVHGATYTGSAYDDIADMMGATDAPHRIEPAILKVDDPASPLMKPFRSRTFPFTDEFYRFPHQCQSTCYSREKLHVLLSIDASQTDLVHGDPIYERPDADYGLVWIKSYGKGRVYNNALGHLDTIFTTPDMAAHLLAAVQFILGDLEADTTPSGVSPPRSGPR